jgi:hypothetical protein
MAPDGSATTPWTEGGAGGAAGAVGLAAKTEVGRNSKKDKAKERMMRILQNCKTEVKDSKTELKMTAKPK